MIYNQEIVLQSFKKPHILKTFDWVRDPYIQNMFLISNKPDYETHLKYWSDILDSVNQKVWAIFYNSVHIGNCGAKYIDTNKRYAELWIYIGLQDHRGRGFGKKSFQLLIEECFRELDVTHYCVNVLEKNIPAIMMYRSLGFHKSTKAIEEIWNKQKEKIIRLEMSRDE